GKPYSGIGRYNRMGLSRSCNGHDCIPTEMSAFAEMIVRRTGLEIVTRNTRFLNCPSLRQNTRRKYSPVLPIPWKSCVGLYVLPPSSDQSNRICGFEPGEVE